MPLLGKVFQNGKEIDRGIWTGGKQWADCDPEQSITICDSSSAYDVENERTYEHNDEKGIYFQELQDNGNGWEVVYDSRERIDKTVHYPLPSWMYSNAPIPNIEHKMKNGDIEGKFKGYIE